MATVRSISPTKHSERLLTRRLTRGSTSYIPLSQKKVTLSKTTPIAVTTVKRRKSSRMSSKKSSGTSTVLPVRLDSFANITTTSDNDDLTTKMASTTIGELPPIRRTSIISNANSTISNIPQIDSDKIVDQKRIEEPQNDNPIANNMNETLSSSTSSSRKSFAENIEFTVESFDTIRTVGTGKTFHFCNNLNKKPCFIFLRNIWSRATCLSS
jgi:hypothetical protein